MASTESLEALGRDYAINFGSQSVSSNREQPADRSVEFLNWWHDAGRALTIKPEIAELIFEAGRQATPKAEPPERETLAASLQHAYHYRDRPSVTERWLAVADAALAQAQRPAEPAPTVAQIDEITAAIDRDWSEADRVSMLRAVFRAGAALGPVQRPVDAPAINEVLMCCSKHQGMPYSWAATIQPPTRYRCPICEPQEAQAVESSTAEPRKPLVIYRELLKEAVHQSGAVAESPEAAIEKLCEPTPMIDRGDWRGVEVAFRMDAYYYGFSATGIKAIDMILSAVACAGKSHHHTDCWTDECAPYEHLRGNSNAEWIQNAADDAAALIRDALNCAPAASGNTATARSDKPQVETGTGAPLLSDEQIDRIAEEIYRTFGSIDDEAWERKFARAIERAVIAAHQQPK